MLMEMKSKGYFISRNISFQNAKVEMAACKEDKDFVILYKYCTNLVSIELLLCIGVNRH